MKRTRPMVSVVMPCLNEEAHIEEVIASILRGSYAGEIELLVVDGNSSDGTRALVAGIARRDPRVRMLDNPRRATPVALNIGIRASRGEIIARTDAHTLYPSDYLDVLIDTLEQSGADVVGCAPDVSPGGKGVVAETIAIALGGAFATGSPFRYARKDRDVDTVPYGCWRRSLFDRLGLFDERFLRNQDFEHASRVRRAGGRLRLSTATRVRYYPRSSLRALWKQASDTGRWNAYMHWLCPYTFRLRHFVPGLFFVAVVTAAGVILVGVLTLQPLVAAAGAGALLPYLVLNVASSIRRSARAKKPWLAPLLSYVVASHHLAYGYGICRGWIDVATGAYQRELGQTEAPAPTGAGGRSKSTVAAAAGA